MCEYNDKKENMETGSVPVEKEFIDTTAEEVSGEAYTAADHQEYDQAAPIYASQEEAEQTAPVQPVQAAASEVATEETVCDAAAVQASAQPAEQNNAETAGYASGANPENYTTYSWSAKREAGQAASAAPEAPAQDAAHNPYAAPQQNGYPAYYQNYQQPGATPQNPYGVNPYANYQNPNAYQQGYAQNPYQQAYQAAQQQPAPARKKKEKKPKTPKEPRFMTRKAAALFMALCIIAAGGVGIGGGILGYRLSGNGSSTSSSGLNLNQGGTPATPTAAKGSELSIAEIAAKTENSVVEIVTEGVTTNDYMQQFIQQGAGSGIIIDSNGYIVTNNHVIEGANKITVTLKNGESYEATLVGTDSDTDVALIKIEATNLQAATLGDSSNLQVGETAVAIGNPLGQLGGTVTNGIVSALDREITIDGKTMTLLQTNAAINPGNSGGGLFNGNGELIGMVVAKSSTASDGTAVEGLGFAIPVNRVKEVAEQLKEYGYVKGRVQLGVSLIDITSTQQAMMYRVNQPGVYIQQITANGAAEKAGLQVGDCILQVNGTDVSTAAEVKAELQKHSVGDVVTLKVLRNNRELDVNVTLQESVPTDDSSSQSNNGQQDNNGNYGNDDNYGNFPFGN